MSKGLATYTNSVGENLELSLDIDLKSQKIQDLTLKGSLVSKYQVELEELKTKILNLDFSEALMLKRSDFHLQTAATTSLSLWLLHQAVEDYLGSTTRLKEQSDLLCLCYGIGVREIKKQVLLRSDYDLPMLISETMATTACGSCRSKIIQTIKTIREENGLIKGLTHSQTNVDKDGRFIKIKNMYPANLVIKLDHLKKEWMKREKIEEQFTIVIHKIEGYHVWLEVTGAESTRAQKIIEALSDYWRGEIGALFFVHLSA